MDKRFKGGRTSVVDDASSERLPTVTRKAVKQQIDQRIRDNRQIITNNI
jgi:hypothetical protein